MKTANPEHIAAMACAVVILEQQDEIERLRSMAVENVLITGPLGGDVTFEVRISARPTPKQWELFRRMMDVAGESFEDEPPTEIPRAETG